MEREYRIGLDIGIGSIGWAVISGDGKTGRIEDFGTRIFDSGENPDGKSRKSQDRRVSRAARRLIRRRYYRKERLKRHLENMGLVSGMFINEYTSSYTGNIYDLRRRAVQERVSPEELAVCLIHICNHRGYRDFYSSDMIDEEQQENLSAENGLPVDSQDKEAQEAGINKQAADEFEEIFKSSGCITIAECICKLFTPEGALYPDIRNRDTKEKRLLIRRKYLQEEVRLILAHQGKYHVPLQNPHNRKFIEEIIFAQRDFEDGPGRESDSYHRYTGFLDDVGQCMCYKEEKRGFRSTVIADIYAVINGLSQYRYVNNQTGEFSLLPEVCRQLVEYTLYQGNITMNDVKRLLKPHHITILKSENSDDGNLAKAVKYLRIVKQCVETSGETWKSFINEEQFDTEKPSRLHALGEVIAKFQTPSRRRKELGKLSFMSSALAKAIAGKKVGGTSNVSYRYMCDAIQAFMRGDFYGAFQAEKLKARAAVRVEGQQRTKILPPLEDDEIKDNPVVFRAINETRKVVNEIIRTYGSPIAINIEVANELGRSFSARREIQQQQKKNEKDNERVTKDIAAKLRICEEEVKSVQKEKYRLYEEQGGKCLYSGRPLGDLQAVLTDTTGQYEIDHIVPFSLILDNTLHNKVLVYGSENQFKRQRTPLMYLSGDEATTFTSTVNYMYSRKEHPISKKKYQYLMLADIYSREAEEMLSNWKSRNIHDTRYITKYLVNYFKEKLLLHKEEKHAVYGIKGAITSKFRRVWLNRATWGSEEKNRENYLHHAVDAVVIANLTPAYIEIASDNMKLQQIYRRHRRVIEREYQEYLEKCITKMREYYGFNEGYTRSLLTKTERVPSYIVNLRDEVDIRFNDTDPNVFASQIQSFYGNTADFILPPRMPLTSHKPERKYRGAISDANPIKVREVDGQMRKIDRMGIKKCKASDIARLYTKDTDLIQSLEAVFAGKDDKYTVEQYMKEQGIKQYVTQKGQPVNKVSVIQKNAVSNYYRKNISEENYAILGSMKYYCIEVYKDKEGKTRTWGIRFVDIVKKNKKLYLKKSSCPQDYGIHQMYLFKNDYIVIKDKAGKIKFQGYYKSAYNVNENRYYYAADNTPQVAKKSFTISSGDTIKKYHMDVLGRIGGEIRCSEPLLWEEVKR